MLTTQNETNGHEVDEGSETNAPETEVLAAFVGFLFSFAEQTDFVCIAVETVLALYTLKKR